ncbi:MAG: hypothetical protein CMP61_09055 [Flavobacteriales bacterium]|nr:hypothetical protein [Flavobacteriales bacterium]|tara:strand:+ start:24584 stop:24901 length:318 start_codon:yes stop_codon:yes gene_type:complete
MIVYSITSALDSSIEQKWVEFMVAGHIALIMETGCFIDYRFVRIIPGQGVDVSYNLQLRCEGHPQLSEFRSKYEKELEQILNRNFEGKYASFQSVLEQVEEGVRK